MYVSYQLTIMFLRFYDGCVAILDFGCLNYFNPSGFSFFFKKKITSLELSVLCKTIKRRGDRHIC